MIKLDVETKGKAVNINADIKGSGDKVAREIDCVLETFAGALPHHMWYMILEHHLEHLMEGDEDDDENEE